MEPARFLADEMLGTLARWLRMLGYDTEYVRDLRDGEVLERAASEGRIILTRDKQLAERAVERGLLIRSDVLEEQLDQVVRAFGLDARMRMTRCTVCNGQLQLMSRDAVAGKVPERVLSSLDEFYLCLRCGQVYWKGSHWDRITNRIDQLLARSGSNPR